MATRGGWLFAPLMLLGCGGSSKSSGSDVTFTNDGCALSLSGTYTATYTLTSGTCGPVAPVRLSVDATPGSPQALQNVANSCPGGTGSDVASPASGGGCTVTESVSGCQIDGQTAAFSGQTTWNSAYTAATGTISIDIQGSCSGTYTMSISQP